MQQDCRDAAAVLDANARDEFVARWTPIKWTYWVTLKWHAEWIDAVTANAHLNRLVEDLYLANVCGGRYPTMRLIGGVHFDPYPHAHAALYLSRRRRAQFVNADEFADWFRLHYWSHGPVWAQAFDPMKRHPQHGGAIEYLSRDVGSVVFG